jgi:RimJ/RimL family protein N-acetyltransferase
MLETERLILRPLERSDLNAIKQWKNDADIKELLGGFSVGFSDDDMIEWYNSRGGKQNDIRYGLAIRDTAELIGYTGLYDIDWVNRRAEFGILIGNKEYWNQVFGVEATQAMLKFAFQDLGLHRVFLEVLALHKTAVKLYTKCGFRKEGELRQHTYRRGHYHNTLVMGLLRDEFLESMSETAK